MSDLVARALAALRQRDFATARDLIGIYASDNTLEIQHYLIKGLAEIAMKDWSAAAVTFHDATMAFPHQAQLWANRGLAEENLGQTDDAARSYEHAIDVNPKQAEAYGNLSNIYRRMGRFIAAEDMAHKAFELGGPKAQVLNTLGLAIMAQGKLDAAERVFNEAHALEPENVEVLANLANLSVDRLDFEKAWLFFAAARAVSDTPLLRRDEGMARLLAADYVAGWSLYEARLELPNALRVRPSCLRWRGENLVDKHLLLIGEQGFGDTLQFFRYRDALVARGARLTWVIRKPLQRLLAHNTSDAVIADDEALPAADYWLPLMSLPFALLKFAPGDWMSTIYLSAPEGPALPAAKAAKKIGLVWSGSPTHLRDHERSIPLEMFAPLMRKRDVQFYAPFTGKALDDITPKLPVTRLDALTRDFADTAALLKKLDALITVDTAVAHLAGGLGIKTYLLLAYCPDWRWGRDGDSTPWYPSIKLLRQPSPGDWGNVLTRLEETLASSM